MFWTIMMILNVLAIIAGLIWYKLNSLCCGGPMLITVGVAVFLISALLAIGQNCYEKNIITEYELLSDYTENYEYSNETEKAIIAGRKYDFNTKLINEKVNAKNYSFFWINPEKIEQLKFLP